MAAFDDFTSGIDKISRAIDGDSNKASQGFSLPANYSADGNGLPYTKMPNNQSGKIKRNSILWFIPEFGTVTMYINPQQISYAYKKVISKDRTKGGYSLQYWGEELPVLSINGTTGSSGIEGINVIEQIYRAEQYAFDGVGLTLAATNSNTAASLAGSIVSAAGSTLGASVGGLFGATGGSVGAAIGDGLLSGILGVDSPNSGLAQKNFPSLAQLAFTVEMYYDGIVYRGFFESMTVTESATDFNLSYQISFAVTQTRGYRRNYLPFHRSAKDGASQYGTPYSYSGKITK